MPTDTPLYPNSFLAHILRKEPLINTAGKEPLRTIPFQRWERSTGSNVSTTTLLVSVDNGNDAFKGAMLHAHSPFLCTTRIITAYAPGKELGSGDGITAWQVNDSEWFWIGEDALQTTAESLSIGTTETRLYDERYRRYLFACLVELLVKSGYELPGSEFQGERDLYVSFGIPNEETTRNGVRESVRNALVPLFNIAYTVRRQDEQGHITTWVLRLVELNPYPQTFGSFVSWYYTLDGNPIERDIIRHLTLDLGGGQFHSCEVTLQHQPSGKSKLRMTASLLEEGTITLARGVQERVRKRYSGIRLSDVEAQQALMSRRVLVEGRRVAIDEIVNEAIEARSPNLLKHLRHHLQDERSFLMFTGGGSILLEAALKKLLQDSQRTVQSFLFVPKELASVLNAVGGYILVQATAQELVERMQASQEQMRG